jgi:hypothetical protein
LLLAETLTYDRVYGGLGEGGRDHLPVAPSLAVVGDIATVPLYVGPKLTNALVEFFDSGIDLPRAFFFKLVEDLVVTLEVSSNVVD